MKNLATDPQLRSQVVGRLLVISIVFCAWVLMIVGRLVQLQVLEGPRFRQQSEAQQQGYVEVSAKRGDILDRRLEELAISVRADAVFAQPRKVEDPVRAAEVLAPLLETPADEILRKLTSGSSFVFLKRRVPVENSRRIQALKLAGIGTQEESARVYPAGKLAAHVLGFVGTDNRGLAGLEHFYTDELSGRRTRIDLLVDARRHSYHRQEPAERTEGKILVLTLDRTLQHITETVLRQTVEFTRALNGSAILMDPHTGELLAMASYPDFDPNRFGEYPAEVLRNRAVLDVYEPGSTFKVITLSALLNEGLVEPDEVVDCRAGTARLAGKVYKEAKHSYGFLTVREVVAKSSNIGTVKLALRLGPDRMYDYLRRFGFGEKTGVDLPGEEAGLLRPTSQWSKLSIGAISIGQEVGVTPLQLARAVAAIANGGYLVRPYLVKRVLSPDGGVVRETAVEKRQILDSATAATMRQILQEVILRGTGTTAAPRGFSAAGKTGTAQKIVDGRYSRSRYVASFAGFAPLEHPRLLALVVINEPSGIPYGGHVAGPAFKEIMERSLLYLGVPQDRPVETEPTQHMARKPRGRKSAPEESEVPLGEAQLRETVLAHLYRGGAAVDVEDVSGLDSPQEVVDNPLPDFTGKTLREVARESARLQLRLKISGAGVAVAQRPAPGRQITPDMVCEVFFAVPEMNRHETPKIALATPTEPRSSGGVRR
jgi:cell division protein FtsI/penicillin-binding protein 2